MAHCLWAAYRDHLEFLEMGVRRDGFQSYLTLKEIGQINSSVSTWGGIVPWVVWGLAERRGLHIFVQYDIWTPEHYLADATPTQTKIINFSDFGDQGITLAPAIYCSLDSQHAFFAEKVPGGNIVLAIQLRRKERDMYTDQQVKDLVIVARRISKESWETTVDRSKMEMLLDQLDDFLIPFEGVEDMKGVGDEQDS